MVLEQRRPVWPLLIVDEQHLFPEAVHYGGMDCGILVDAPMALAPFEADAAPADSLAAFIVLLPRVATEQLEVAPIDEQPGSYRLGGNPAESDIGQAGFVFRVAAADIGMVAGKPELLEPRTLRLGARWGIGVVYPGHSVEIRPALVQRERMPGIAHPGIEAAIEERHLEAHEV